MKLSKGIIQVIIANIINLIISIGNGFFLPKYLSVESYADYKIFILYISYVGILHLGYVDGVYIKYGGKAIDAIKTEELEFEKKVLALFQIIISVPIILFSLFLDDTNLLFAAISILPMNMLYFFKFVYQATGEFKKYRYITNLSTGLVFILNLSFLFIFKIDNSFYYIITQVFVYFFVWFSYENKHKSKAIGNRFTFKEMSQCLKGNIHLGIIIMLGNFMGLWITSIDRWFVKILHSITEFAYYSFAVTMLKLINVVVTAFSITLYNFFCKKPDEEKIIELRKIVLVAGAFIIALIFPIDLIIQIYLEKYIYAIPIIRLLFLAQFILIGINAIYLNLYKASNLQKKYLIQMLVTTIIAFVSNFIMRYLWRDNIAAYAAATIVTAFIWLILCQADLPQYKFSKKEWIFIFLTMLVYCISEYFNVWLGMPIYIGSVIMETFILFPKDTKLVIKLAKEMLNAKEREL